MGHSEWGLLVCTAGIARNLLAATKGKQFTKADTEQTYPVITSTILTYATTGAITHTHTHTHMHARTHAHTPKEDEIARKKESR